MPRDQRPSIKAQANADGSSVQLYIYDDIGPEWLGMVAAKSVQRALSEISPTAELHVHINSVGGDVFEGTAIYNLFNAWAGDVHVHVDGAALSAASLIAMAGDRIHMAENAVMMIHEPWTITWGTADELVAAAETLRKLCAGLAKTYAARTAKSEEKIAALLKAETWMTADEAKAEGFADEITPSKSTTDENPAASAGILERFRNVPQRVAAMLRSHNPEPKPMPETKPDPNASAPNPSPAAAPNPTPAPAAAAPAPQASAPPAEGAPAAKTGPDFIKAYGNDGAVWFAEGKTFEAAAELHRAKLTTENETLRTKLAAVERGEKEPAGFNAAPSPRGGEQPKKAAAHEVLKGCIKIRK